MDISLSIGPNMQLCTKINSESSSRILYGNPVCLLTTVDPANSNNSNVMTISWLSCTDNDGNFMMSMNQNRNTTKLLLSTKQFVLNIPVKGMEELVLAIGRCHGGEKSMNKFKRLGINTCEPGWTVPKDNNSITHIGITKCVAHLVCTLTSHLVQHNNNNNNNSSTIEDNNNNNNHNELVTNGHYILWCKIEHSYVLNDYWNGKQFIPRSNNVPPFLSFLGSQQFAYVLRLDSEDETATTTTSTTTTTNNTKIKDREEKEILLEELLNKSDENKKLTFNFSDLSFND